MFRYIRITCLNKYYYVFKYTKYCIKYIKYLLLQIIKIKANVHKMALKALHRVSLKQNDVSLHRINKKYTSPVTLYKQDVYYKEFQSKNETGNLANKGERRGF